MLYMTAMCVSACVHCPVLQQHLFSALGRELTPTFLGGDLDFDAVSHHWYDKMDAAIAERQAHPKGHQVSRMAAQSGPHADPAITVHGGNFGCLLWLRPAIPLG